MDEEQFNAAVDLLKQQQPNVGEYWADAAKQIQSFANEDVVVGTTWQYQYFALQAEDAPVAASPASQGFLPEEGATGWSDTWMISSQAAHPNCMYLWMDHIVSPLANAEVAQYFGEAPAQSKSCEPATFEKATKALEYPARPEVLRQLPRRGPGFLGATSTTGSLRWRTAAMTAATYARTTTTGSRPGPRSRGESSRPVIDMVDGSR